MRARGALRRRRAAERSATPRARACGSRSAWAAILLEKSEGPLLWRRRPSGRSFRNVLPGADRFLRGLRDTELEDRLGGNLDGLAGLRIAAHALLALHDHELANPRERETLLGLAIRKLRDLFEDQ